MPGAGFDVALLAPKDSLAQHSRFIGKIGYLPEQATAQQWAHAFAATVKATSPQIVLPCDDMAFRYGSFPVVIAKTHLSLSSDPTLLGAPTGWRMPVREVRAAVGAGYVYAICGDMRTMPGLSGHPAAERIDIDENGEIVGLS